MFIIQISTVGSVDFTLITPRHWNSFSLTSLGRMQHVFCSWGHSHRINFLVPPGTHHCLVNRGGVDLKLAQGFYTWPVLRESNSRPFDLRSNALGTWPRACVLHRKNPTQWWETKWSISSFRFTIYHINLVNFVIAKLR